MGESQKEGKGWKTEEDIGPFFTAGSMHVCACLESLEAGDETGVLAEEIAQNSVSKDSSGI